LGDFYAHQFGLSHEPDITFYDLACTDECIVTVGSDGIWDCRKWETFAEYVNSNLTKLQIQTDKVVNLTLQYTIEQAKACFGESAFDDASLLLVSLVSDLFPPIEQVYPNEYMIMPPLTGTVNQTNNKGNNRNYSNSNNVHEESKEFMQTVSGKQTIPTNDNHVGNKNRACHDPSNHEKDTNNSEGIVDSSCNNENGK